MRRLIWGAETFSKPSTPTMLRKGIEKATAEEGRYFVRVSWKNCDYGHIFCVERDTGGKLISFDPQTGEKGMLDRYLRSANGRRVAVLRVDNLDFDRDFVTRVLTKQATPVIKGVAEAKKIKGGTFGAPANGKKAALIARKQKILNNAITKSGHYNNLNTGQYYETKSSIRRAIGHAATITQLRAYNAVRRNPAGLKFIGNSPLGATKNMANPKDINNIKKKTMRGVTSYNIYEFQYKGSTWIVKTEVYKGIIETLYYVRKK